MKLKRPMKPATIASEEDLELLSYPVYVSPKLDGIRAVVHDEGLLSNSGKLLPNKYVQQHFTDPELAGLDGELICGDPCADGVFNRTSSVVMSNDKAEGNEVTFYVFDVVNELLDWPAQTYDQRFETLALDVAYLQNSDFRVELVPQFLASNPTEVIELMRRFCTEGYEGICIRSPDGKYKHGRSTFKQQYLLKWKPFVDSDAIIIGVNEAMRNDNAATIDEQGYTKRSSHKDNKTGKGYVGALECQDLYDGRIFNTGVFLGTTIEQRKYWWEHKEDLINQCIKYKHMEYGAKDLPRIPKFLSFRPIEDIEWSTAVVPCPK